MELQLGQSASFSKRISEENVLEFARLTGDFNSVHIDSVQAQKGPFGRRIAHGMLVGSMISTVLGMHLPGKGTIYLEQSMKFKKPVYLDDTVTATVVVTKEINVEKRIYMLDTNVFNQYGDVVIEGYAVVKVKE